MPFGDIGGAVTELIITCRTPDEGEIRIAKGDAVTLVGNYTVTSIGGDGDPVFGQAMASATANDVAIPIKVRGIAIFDYTGAAPVIGKGVTASERRGVVRAAWSAGTGINVKIDEMASQVHVLM